MKVIRINKCSQCPHSISWVNLCWCIYDSEVDRQVDPHNIPSWCPLEDLDKKPEV